MHHGLKRLTPFTSTESGGSQLAFLAGTEAGCRGALAGRAGARRFVEEDAAGGAALASSTAEGGALIGGSTLPDDAAETTAGAAAAGSSRRRDDRAETMTAPAVTTPRAGAGTPPTHPPGA